MDGYYSHTPLRAKVFFLGEEHVQHVTKKMEEITMGRKKGRKTKKKTEIDKQTNK